MADPFGAFDMTGDVGAPTARWDLTFVNVTDK